MSTAFQTHLASGATQICQCWRITRRDGQVQGFTDHDRALRFDSTEFQAASGLSPQALQQTSGLSADNSGVLGALSSEAISGDQLRAGIYDRALIEIWQVHWPDPEIRELRFRGNIGEVSLKGAQFTAEIRGLSDRLNMPFGRVIQGGCAAVLGDAACKVDLDDPAHHAQLLLESLRESRILRFSGSGGIAAGRFDRGRMTVLSGDMQGQIAAIKRHEIQDGQAQIELWEPLRIPPRPGDLLRLEVGCDKSLGTCRTRFGNHLNFRGFPHVPGDDWLMAYPRTSGNNTGGSLQS